MTNDVKANVDRDSRMEFYIARERPYGKHVQMPQEFLDRFMRAYDEYEACQNEMRKYWDAAGNP